MNKRAILLLISILSFAVCFAQENKKREKEYKELRISVNKKPQTGIKVQEKRSSENVTYNEQVNIDTSTEYSNGWNCNYANIGFVATTMSQDNIQDLESNFGASFTIGRTFYLHENPILDIMRFGIDVTWLDFSYTNYKIKHITNSGTNNYKLQQAEAGIHVGPSLTIRADEKLYIHAYFRYAPSYSAIKTDSDSYSNYATFFVGGSSITYGSAGIGIETRFGNCRYSGAERDECAFITDDIKHNGFKVYVNFRF